MVRMATVGRIDSGKIQAGRKARWILGDDDGVALRNGSDVHRKTHGAVLGDEAEVAGDDARSLNGFIRGRRGKDHGNADGLNDRRIDEGHGQLLQIVGEGQQIAANVEIGVAVNARPERSVGGIFADHGVVADELDGQRIVVHQQLGGNGEVGFGVAAVGAAELPWRGLDGGEERSVHDELELAELRNEAGRKGVVDVNAGGARPHGFAAA